MWAAGIAGGAAAVSNWAIVGPGYNRLLSAVVVVVGAAVALTGNLVVGLIATVLAFAAGVFGRRHQPAAVLFALSATGFLVVAETEGGFIPAVTGTVLLGAMTSVMLLGHWFLVDPQLPRQALQRLDVVAGTGVVADAVVLVALGALGAGDGVMIGAFAALAIMSALLTTGVWFSLREPAYSGVMAATGLSYLGVLTAFGAVVVGRLLLGSQ